MDFLKMNISKYSIFKEIILCPKAKWMHAAAFLDFEHLSNHPRLGKKMKWNELINKKHKQHHKCKIERVEWLQINQRKIEKSSHILNYLQTFGDDIIL